MPVTNTLPLFNFAKEYGWNPIEANLLGASAIISGDTPIQNVLHTMQTYTASFGGQTPAPTNKPRFCSDKAGKVVPCNSPDAVPYDQRDGVTNDPSRQDPKLPRDPRIYKPDGSIIPESERQKDADGGIPLTREEADKFKATNEKQSSSVFDDWFKRIALVIAGIVLLAVAVASLR